MAADIDQPGANRLLEREPHQALLALERKLGGCRRLVLGFPHERARADGLRVSGLQLRHDVVGAVRLADIAALPGDIAGVVNVDATAARITAAGGTLLSEPADRPWGVRMFQFNDPDGFKLGVSTPLKG